MKHVQENLFQFKEHKFFQLFEEEEAEVVNIAQEQDEVGNSVVEKAKENFSRFEKDSKGVVMRYKEFWEENEAMKGQFGEGAKIYKMFDSTYVIGLMDLPDEALEPEVINQDMDNTEEPEEEIEESEGEDELKKDSEGEDEKEDDSEGEDEKVNEAFEEPEGENELGFEAPEETAAGTDSPAIGGPDPLKKTIPVEEHPIETAEEEVLDTPGQPKKCVVVYNMNGENREEIFRCSSNSVMHAFEEFYENGFKGAMKAIIAKAREKQEVVKKEREVKAKEEELQVKKTKVDQFLKGK